MTRQYRRKGPKSTWKVLIPQEIALPIELYFYDPNARRADYGARSRLVTELLEKWWDELPEEEKAKTRIAAA